MNNRIAEIQQQCEKRNTTNPIIIKNNLATVDVVRALMEEITSCNEDVTYLLAQLAERDKEIEQLKESQRWIPVSERLPDDDVPVLATYIGFIDKKPHSDAVAKWSIELNGYNGGWAWEINGSDVNVAITHWMSLPEPPEKGE